MTLTEQRLHYAPGTRVLFGIINALYGSEGTLQKFRVLEVLARVPYQAWGQIAYQRATGTSARSGRARELRHIIVQSRAQQDNEQWHLFVIDELIETLELELHTVRHQLFPLVIAALYHPASWLLAVVSPAAAYRLNAEFEDHAELDYLRYVAQHPELDDAAFHSSLTDVFGHLHTVADVLRQIAHDERTHRDACLTEIARIKGDPSDEVTTNRPGLRNEISVD
jgi:hypothetical protein